MCTHDLWNLLNQLRKSDKMRCLPSVLSLFSIKFNKFNNTGVRMLDFIYQIISELFKIAFLA